MLTIDKPRDKVRPKLDLGLLFVPVIFANGEDDDVPGLVAAIEHKPVQFDERIYAPDEDIVISGRSILLKQKIYVAESFSTLPEPRDGWVDCVEGKAGRHITINDCDIITEGEWDALP